MSAEDGGDECKRYIPLAHRFRNSDLLEFFFIFSVEINVSHPYSAECYEVFRCTDVNLLPSRATGVRLSIIFAGINSPAALGNMPTWSLLLNFF